MTTIKLDSSNNIVLLNADFNVIESTEAVAQDTKNRIAICYGEDPFDIYKGLDFEGELLQKMGGADNIKEQIRNRILDSDEVVNVNSLTITKTAQTTLTVEAEINSIYGTLNL